jgi:hypothetical protein
VPPGDERRQMHDLRLLQISFSCLSFRDHFAERQLGSRAEPVDQIVVDANRVGAAVKHAEPEPFVEERLCNPVRLDRGRESFGNRRKRCICLINLAKLELNDTD